MSVYKVLYNATTKEAKVRLNADGAAAGSGFVNIGTFNHPKGEGEPETLGSEVNHVIFQHVQEMFYLEEGEQNMQAVKIIEYRKTIPVTGISTSPATITLDLSNAQTQQITATISPNNATETGVKYFSSDVTKATVSPTGLITPVAVGTATITGRTVDGQFTDTTVVTVVA